MQRIYALIFLTVILVSLSTTVFAQAGAEGSAALPELSWVDAENGATLFSLSDIVRFDWERQIFELKPERATEILAQSISPDKQYRDFAVRDREGVIYRGRFYRSVAKEGFDGATILIDQGLQKKLPAAPFFSIAGGYPSAGGAHDADRFAERLQTALQQAGLLGAIKDTEMPFSRVWSGHAWVGGEQVIKASAVLFPETFRLAQDTYLHLLLYKGQNPDFAYDKLIVEATCTGDEGRFVSKQEILRISYPLLDNGIYVCKFRPWEGMASSPTTSASELATLVKPDMLPRYPKDAANEEREGAVITLVTLSADRKVSDVALIQSSGFDDIDRSVTRAVQRWAFNKQEATPEQAGSQQVKLQFNFRRGKVTLRILPPDPVKVVAQPGPMDLEITFLAMKREGESLNLIGSWSLPIRKLTLLPTEQPALPVPAPAP